jgi:hypothetical protein
MDKKKRNRKKTKRQISARVNINLLDRVDNYINLMNERGLTIKKVDIFEKALFEYIEKIEKELINEK